MKFHERTKRAKSNRRNNYRGNYRLKTKSPKYTLFYIRIYFIRISRLKFAKFLEYFKNKAEAEIFEKDNFEKDNFVC